VASHAKPGKMTNAKGKVKTAAAVTSVLAVSGGVAAGLHLHQQSLRNSTEAAAQDGNAAGAAAAGALAARNAHATDVNRDAQRPDLAGSSSSAPSTSADSSSAPAAPQPSTPTPTSDSSSPLPGASGSPVARSSSSTTSSSAPTTSRTTTTSKPTTTTSPTAPSTSSSTSSSVGMGINATPAQAQAIAKQLVPSGQYACFANIISRESSWDVHATNPSSGAYGLGQALPGDKMASYGSDWRNSATIQIKWALAYMTGRYGSPCAAWTFWQNHSWY
jgi:hypothetical protein